MTDKLKKYREKRDFSQTREPEGKAKADSSGTRYVMHMHAASHHHFDLRLEEDGVLRSWALPKGPSLKPGEKRLAVQVEDHPLDYGDFEGVIPEGEYGGGTVMLWDHGEWEPRSKPREDRIDFELHGEKLKGHWTLVRIHDKKASGRAKNKTWLLIKRSEGDPGQPDDRSVITGRTMAQIAAEDAPPERGNSPFPAPEKLRKARRKPLPDNLKVQLATLVEAAPEGNEWLHELKFDGYRLIARIDKGKVTLYTRNGKDWTRRFPAIARSLKRLPLSRAILDGEAVIPEADGSTSFRKLQEHLSSKSGKGAVAPVFQIFDLLYLEGYDLTEVPLLERKRTLEQMLAAVEHDDLLRYSDHVQGQGHHFYEQVCEMGLEGMVSKKTSSTYRGGRQPSWQKTKCTQQDEFVVGGLTRPSGTRKGFGSLLLGAWSGEELIYTGRVGSGFNQQLLTDLARRLKPLQRKTSPFAGEVPDQAGVQWVRPELVVDVEFTERTASGVLRHPVFRGVRDDKSPEEVQMAQISNEADKSGANKAGASKKKSAGRSGGTTVAGVEITHPDRILFSDQGITKLDVARYYDDQAPEILAHLANRPLSLLRCPEGLEGDCFFQKHPEKNFAAAVPRTEIAEKQGQKATYLYVTSAADLVSLVQFGVLEFHLWGCLVDDVEKPDTLIFDLDPGPEVSWSAIAKAATSLKERLGSLGLTSFLQATGGKGLHLILPVKPERSWEELKAFAHGIARAHAQDEPGRFTTNMSKAKRRGKVFIDYLRNGRGSTSIARYSTRARPGATVATPLRWEELTPGATANRYHLNNIRRRMSALKSDPWEGYEEARNTLSKSLLKKYQET